MSSPHQKALNKKIDQKYDKLNAKKGLTPSGKRKWHYYNTSSMTPRERGDMDTEHSMRYK